MAEKMYLNQTDVHNKFWSYEVIGNDVLVKWGRVGLVGESQVKEFSSDSAQQKFIADKVREKEKKGYKLVTQEKIKQETQTAKELGWQYKIQRIKWAGKFGNKISFISEYDPTKWVYVEIMDSWKKDIVRLLLSKSESYTLEGDIKEDSETIKFRDAQLAHNGGMQFVEAVRNHLKRLYEKVAAIVIQKFAAMGVRKLNLGDGIENDTTQKQDSATMFDIYNEVGDSGASNQVIAQFASLGKRKLDL
jgi:predicted DNA-binding WGR domain protein